MGLISNVLLFFCFQKWDLYTSGERRHLMRYVMEDNFKPPIFGSYSYNPILQTFELPENRHNNTVSTTDIQSVNPAQSDDGNQTGSTVALARTLKQRAQQMSTKRNWFRKHVKSSPLMVDTKKPDLLLPGKGTTKENSYPLQLLRR